MNTPIFNLNLKDVTKGIVTAIFAAVLMTVYQVVSAPNFDFFAIDWNALIHTTVNAAGAAFFAYLAKNLLTAENGKILGKIG